MGRGAGFPNEEQRAIIDAVDGARLILAPAGTGKTRVMAGRLARFIEGGGDSDRALCVTFTNRAASEMRARVEDRLGQSARRIHVRTFHGLCAWILRRDARMLGLPRDYVIYDDRDSIELLEQVLKNSRGRIRNARPNDFFWRLSSRKSNASGAELALARIPPLYLRGGEEEERQVADRYHMVLAERHALDFADLIYRVRALFAHVPRIRKSWASRFGWVQVDEVQDTHDSEYQVIRTLAESHGNLALFGDVDQTIYEWRGSNPHDVLGRFQRDFDPVRRHFLALNYRATKELLQYADRFADTFRTRRTQLVPHPELPEGERVRRIVTQTSQEEARCVAKEVARLRRDDPECRIGVLARAHKRLRTVSAALEAAGVEHVTVEEFEFFRRQEIKDAVARLRIILNPFDSGALRRILTRPASGVGKQALDDLYRRGAPAGLRLTDMVRAETFDLGEPFAALLTALDGGTVVVFDVETTGLSPLEDEVVEIAATKLVAGSVVDTFHRLLRPTGPVGDSESIHGYSDAELARKGEDPAGVLAEFEDFVAEAHLVGHNVRFDLEMIRHHGQRLGVDVGESPFDDTLDLARRLVVAERYDLSTLAEVMSLRAKPSHRADDDVAATTELLLAMHPGLRDGSSTREELVRKYGRRFEPIARSIHDWRKSASETRPPVLMERILRESGLRDVYQSSSARQRHLDELVSFFHTHDRTTVHSWSAMEELTQLAALARNVDHLDTDDFRIPVVTVHQSKGLEFDTVFVVGMCEGEFPSYLAEKENRIEEERRLFYVALTRACRRLFLCGHEINDFGRRKGASRFIRG